MNMIDITGHRWNVDRFTGKVCDHTLMFGLLSSALLLPPYRHSFVFTKCVNIQRRVKFERSRCFQHLVSKENLKYYQRADSKLKFNLEKRVATALIVA